MGFITDLIRYLVVVASLLMVLVLCLLLLSAPESGLPPPSSLPSGPHVDELYNRASSLLGWETCEHPHVHNAGVKRLRNALNKELFGQHLAVNITVTAVKAHLEDPDPPKALVLSFHGWAGGGKTFTSKHMINSLYKRGVNSSYVRFFLASYHFPDPAKISEYQKLIKRTVVRVVRSCPRALFVFDEVEKIPTGVLDALVPYIQHPGNMLDGNNYKKAIYVFLSNTGANEITRIAERAWQDGKRREELTFKDFSDALSNEAFTSKPAGLYRSRMIEKVLVDHFIPFLPLERQHVTLCIKAEAKRHRMNETILDGEAERIADMLSYYPEDLRLYSTTGCKKVDGFVKYRIAELELENYIEDHSNGDSDDDDKDDDPYSKTEF